MTAIEASAGEKTRSLGGTNRPWLRALELTARIPKHPGRLLSTVIEEWAAKSGGAPALLSDQQSLTYGALDQLINRYTRWALQHDLGKGDTVCLMLPNGPEYLAIWLGIARTGCTVALLNTHLAGAALAHCVNLAHPKHIIIAEEFVGRLSAGMTAKVWTHVPVELYSPETLNPGERPAVTIADRALLIYTSGTTGLPKAANISHARLMQWSHWFAGLLETTPGDRLYNCLPMYHSVGGIVATGAVLAAGGSVAIREGFSASRFWNDIVQWDCTLFQYIGELCRYLLNYEAAPTEAEHRLRMCCGNGLRPDIWDRFQTRFRIPRILEFYASTEGNVSLFNVEGRRGSVGRVPAYLTHRFPAALVKFDPDKEEPVRNRQGFCERAEANEAGEALGRITSSNRFEGYTNDAESERKILRDVFETGDAWFRTGDLMRRDEQGYFYFVDRIGDTFRWKGENVSTTEIAEAIASFPGVLHANVYGVAVPGAEGRAGMALVAANEDLDLVRLRAHLHDRLPEYAHPLFLRLGGDLPTTTTFKYSKQDLVRQGYDPSAVPDALYFNDRQRRAFVRLDSGLYQRLMTGEVRL